MNENLVSYYKDRAGEYDKLYSKPERQNDLLRATEILQEIFTEKQVLEIACGTGFWTERIAKTAKIIIATDINQAMLDVASTRKYHRQNVHFSIADMYDFAHTKKYPSLFAGFIWSHVPLARIQAFVQSLSQMVLDNGTIVPMDNLYVAGSNLPIAKTDPMGNTYQRRKLLDGSTHLVLKNFPTDAFLREQFHGIASNIRIIHLEYYWILVCTTDNKSKSNRT